MGLLSIIVLSILFALIYIVFNLLAWELIKNSRADRLQYSGPFWLRVKDVLFWVLGSISFYGTIVLFSTSIVDLKIEEAVYKPSIRLSEHLNSTDSGRLLKESGITLVRMPLDDDMEAYRSYPWLPHHTGIKTEHPTYISMLVRLEDDRWAVYVDPDEVEKRSSFQNASDRLDLAVNLITEAVYREKAKEQLQADTGEHPSLKWSD